MYRVAPRVLLAVILVLGAAAPGRPQQPGTTQFAGGGGGRIFVDGLPQSGARIAEVRIMAGDRIDSVQVEYEMPNGRTEPGQRHGGSGGQLSSFRLDRDEYITGISGRCGEAVDSLQIHTNRRSSPLFGGSGGSRDYRFDVPRGNEATGFAGRSGSVVDAIGLAYGPRSGPFSRGPFGSRDDRGGRYDRGRDDRGRDDRGARNDERGGATSIAGGGGGTDFADREASGGGRLVEVRIQAGEKVDSIQAVYLLDNGRLAEGARHGGGGGSVATFRLDRDEYIISLSGRYGDTIDSLRIHTNRRDSQVFGGRGGNRDFRVDVPAGYEAIGFTGRAARYLDAVGLTYEPARGRSRFPWQRP